MNVQQLRTEVGTLLAAQAQKAAERNAPQSIRTNVCPNVAAPCQLCPRVVFDECCAEQIAGNQERVNVMEEAQLRAWLADYDPWGQLENTSVCFPDTSTDQVSATTPINGHCPPTCLLLRLHCSIYICALLLCSAICLAQNDICLLCCRPSQARSFAWAKAASRVAQDSTRRYSRACKPSAACCAKCLSCQWLVCLLRCLCVVIKACGRLLCCCHRQLLRVAGQVSPIVVQL